MRTLSRILLALYSLVLILACAGLGVLAWNEDQKLDANVGDVNVQGFIDASDPAKWAFTGILAAVGVVGVLTFLVAVAAGRRVSGGTLRLRQAEGGYVEVRAAGLETLLAEELQRLPDVRAARPHVRVSGGVVTTELDLVIEPSANIATVTNATAETIARVLREDVGVKDVRRPSVRIRYDEVSARPVGPAPPGRQVAAPASAQRDDTKDSSTGGEPPDSDGQ